MGTESLGIPGTAPGGDTQGVPGVRGADRRVAYRGG